MSAALRARSLAICDLAAAYRNGHTTPVDVVNVIYDRIDACSDRAIWISLLSRERALERATKLSSADPASMPLYGVSVLRSRDKHGLCRRADDRRLSQPTPTQRRRAPPVIERAISGGGRSRLARPTSISFATGSGRACARPTVLVATASTRTTSAAAPAPDRRFAVALGLASFFLRHRYRRIGAGTGGL
jgi:hypothetical protein